jgi:hypothetical protein
VLEERRPGVGCAAGHPVSCPSPRAAMQQASIDLTASATLARPCRCGSRLMARWPSGGRRARPTLCPGCCSSMRCAQTLASAGWSLLAGPQISLPGAHTCCLGPDPCLTTYDLMSGTHPPAPTLPHGG